MKPESAASLLPQVSDPRRRKARVFSVSDLHKTRADIIKQVNLQLLPISRVVFLYCPIMGLVLWLYVLTFPYLYIESCREGMYMSAHIIYGLIAVTSFIFEVKVARKIVKVIELLSGHTRLSNFQLLRLAMGQLGRLDIYTNFCFVVICFECGSSYAYYALGIRVLSSSVLFILQVKNCIKHNVISLQLLEFITLFDLLGKFQIMYIEGDKSSELLRTWVKTGSVLPCFKFFVDDIWQFIIQLLFLLEQEKLSVFVCVSLCVSIVFSFLSVFMVYLRYRLFTPNGYIEQDTIQAVKTQLDSGNIEGVKLLLTNKNKFRRFAQETRAEILRLAAVTDFDLFVYLTDTLINNRNDALLHNELLHEKLLQSLRKCKHYPDTLLQSIEYLKEGKGIFINLNKHISISNEGTLLHCLMDEPHFLLRTLVSGKYDLVQFVTELGAEVDAIDKFGETPTTLAARLNFEVLIRSSSSKTLRDLFDVNRISMSKREVDARIKDWARGLVLYFSSLGVNILHRNKKGKTVLEIAAEAGNVALVTALEQVLKSSNLSFPNKV